MDPYTLTPLGADPVSLAALQARAMLDSGRHHRARDGRGRGAQPPRRDGQPERAGDGRARRRRAARRAVLHRAVAQARPAADLRRRERGDHGDRRQGPRALRAPGVDPRHRPPHRDPPARVPRPARVAVDGARRQGRRRGRRRRRRRRALASRSATRRRSSRRRWAWATASTSTRRAVRSRRTR